MSELKIINKSDTPSYPILDMIMERYSDMAFKLLTGYNECVIGVCERTYRLIYSKTKIIEQLSKEMEPEEDESPYEMAMEYYDYNISGAFFGEDTPILCDDFFD